MTIFASVGVGTANSTSEDIFNAVTDIFGFGRDPDDPFEELTDTLTITYTVAPGGADPVERDDYRDLPEYGTLVLDSYELYDAVGIDVVDDCLPEDWESLVVTIISVESDDPDFEYTINSASATGYIEDNDPVGNPSPACYTIPPPPPPTCETCEGSESLLNMAPSPAARSGAANSGGSPGQTAYPVRYFDGAVITAATDLESTAGGIPWGVTRTWTNVPNYAPNNFVGSGMVVAERPTLMQLDGGDDVALLADGTTAQIFEWDAGNSKYVAGNFQQEKLEYNSTTDEFTLTDLTGAKFTFYDFSSSLYVHQKGQLKSYTDPSGNVTALSYAVNGRLTEITRSSTVGSTTINESFLYAYVASGENWGLVDNITLRRNTGGGAWSTVRQVTYDYYDSTEIYGNVGDLQTATITDGTNVLDITYYRYYTPADLSTGYERGLKYVFKPASYARLVAAEGSALESILDEDAAPFADHYFEYDSQQRVTKETAQGAGCSSCTGGQGSFTLSYTDSANSDGYNSWAVETVETLPRRQPNNRLYELSRPGDAGSLPRQH